MLKEQKYTILVLLAFFIWAIISSFWYTCGLKGFCQDNKIVVEEQIIDENKEEDNEEILELEDERGYTKFIPLNNDSLELEKDLKINQTVKTVETVKTEKRTITCMSHINSGIRLNSSLNIESEVKNLQKFLNDYYDGELDVNGQYGQDDKNTVIKFQELNNLDADGAVGPQTRRIINAIYCVKNENTN